MAEQDSISGAPLDNIVDIFLANADLAGLLVTLGAVGLAIACALWATKLSRALRKAEDKRNTYLAGLEARLDAAEVILAAEPDAVFIWSPESLKAAPGTFQARPRIVGSTATLTDPASGDLDFDYLLSRLEQDHAGRLRNAVHRLRTRGARFSHHVQSKDGRTFEAEGRPAGAQAVLWLRDVTGERQEVSRLVDSLRRAEFARDQLHSLMTLAPFPFWQHDEEGNLTWANPAYIRAVDAKDLEDVLTRGAELIGEENKKAAHQKVLDGGVVRERTYAVIAGERRAVDVVTMKIQGGIGAMAMDVSELDDAQAELKRHIDAHAATLDKVATAVAICGPDQRLKFYNQAYAKLWELDPGWLKSEPTDGEILDALRAERRLPEQANFQAWKASRMELYTAADPVEEYWHLPDGQTLRVVGQAHPFGGVIYIYENVTEKLNLESSYNTLMGVQRETIDHLYEGVAVFGSDGRLQLHNPAYAKIWGLDERDLAGTPHIDGLVEACRPLFDHGEEWDKLKTRITSMAVERSSQSGRMSRPDGHVIDYAIVPLPDGATLLTYVDVTDSTRIERALRDRNEALETADRLKSEFIGHVSYQLRTPLTNIAGFGEILEAEMFGALNPRQHEYMQGILASSSQLLDTVNDILDLSIIEAGAMTLDLSSVELGDVIFAAQAFAERPAQKNKVTLKVECPADIGAVKADEKRIKQIMINLLSNALAFTGPGDTITVGTVKKKGQVELYVADTGDGIKPEHQAAVFDRFEARGGDKSRGAGLGLSLVRSFVELHGGWVSLESEPSKGTKVTCHLPERAAAAAPSAAKDDPAVTAPVGERA